MDHIKDLKKSISQFEIETEDCGICSNRSYFSLSKSDRYKIPINHVICKNCGLIQSKKKYKFKYYKSFYDKFYKAIYERHNLIDINQNFVDREKKGQYIYNLVSKFKKLNSNSKILDIGCGDGAIISYFHNLGIQSIGIDINKADVLFGKKKGLRLYHKTIEELQINEKYDFVIFRRTLEHLHNPRLSLKKIKAILKDDGLIYISVPSLDSLLYSSDPKKINIQNQLHFAHIYFFSKKTLSNLMATCDMKCIFINHHIDSLWVKGKSAVKFHYRSVLITILIIKYFKYMIILKNLLFRLIKFNYNV